MSGLNVRKVVAFDKVPDKLLHDEIIKLLGKHDMIWDSQHGFRSGRSCTTNLLAFLDQVTKVIDSGGSLDAVFLDFAKAFDTVPHGRLIAKLRAHGFGGRLWPRLRLCLKIGSSVYVSMDHGLGGI